MSKGLWIPIEILNDRKLTPMEKFFLAEIIQFDKAEGCYALNAHFAGRFGIGKSRASQIISGLSAKGYVNCTLQRKGKQVISRTITPLGNLKGVCRKPKEGIEKCATPPLEKREGIKQGIKHSSRQQHLIPPTCAELRDYANAIGYSNFDAEHFLEHYSAAEWKRKDGSPVKNWKQTVLSWKRREKKDGADGNTHGFVYEDQEPTLEQIAIIEGVGE